MAKRQPRAKRVGAKRQARPKRVALPPPDDPDLIYEEWTDIPSGQVDFRSRDGMVAVSFSPAQGVGITGLRIGYPKPAAATQPVRAGQGQTKPRSKQKPPRRKASAAVATKASSGKTQSNRKRPPAKRRAS